MCLQEGFKLTFTFIMHFHTTCYFADSHIMLIAHGIDGTAKLC